VAGHVQRAVETGEPFVFETEIVSARGRARVVRGRGEAWWEGGACAAW
jgi:hypothetical protein